MPTLRVMGRFNGLMNLCIIDRIGYEVICRSRKVPPERGRIGEVYFLRGYCVEGDPLHYDVPQNLEDIRQLDYLQIQL